MTLLITGASGKLGREFGRSLKKALTPSHQELDVTNRDSVFTYIQCNSVDTIIHCAALTSVRQCEESRRLAYSVNVEGTRNLVRSLLGKPNAYFIYVSTACVFSGDDPNHFYTEKDLPYPKNFYGLTKVLAEIAVSDTTEIQRDLKALIIRTNFVTRGKWMYPSAFTDRFGTYLYTDQVAQAIIRLIKGRRTGIIHVCGNKRMSMYELARLTDPDIKPITLADYQGPPLTINMCLSSTVVPTMQLQL